MSFLDQLEELGKAIRSWIYTFIFFFLFFFIFGIGQVTIFGKEFTFIRPGMHSFSTLMFERIRDDLLTEEIELIVTNPLEALWAQIGIALFLAFAITLPYFLYKLITFFSSAFTKKEKKIVVKSIVPGSLLFIFGGLFSYFLLIPITFHVLYEYVLMVEARPFFDISEFIFYVLVLVLGVGILFMFPILMVTLTKFGLVSARGWKENWRYAFIGFLIFSAILTPDGSGVTMLILSIPLTVLYLGGYIISRRIED